MTTYALPHSRTSPCSFHGIFPSKNKEEQRIKKAQLDLARRQHASSEVANQSEVAGLQRVRACAWRG